MMNDRPQIFISATSSDLGSCRQLVKETLLTLGCIPIEQTNFPPAASKVREMLRTKVGRCDAVIHIVGNVYGAEPREQSGDCRRSYTQLEHEIARELKKPVYSFICSDDFPFDEHTTEDDLRQQLQRQHRIRLLDSDYLYTEVSSQQELKIKVQQLQDRVEKLTKDLSRAKSRLLKSVMIALIAVLLLAVWLYRVGQQNQSTQQQVVEQEARLSNVESEFKKQRRYLEQIAAVYTKQQAELNQYRLTEQQKFDLAVNRVANDAGIPENELRSAIDLFIAAIESDSEAEFYDLALVQFAQRHFAEAADTAQQAAQQARRERVAAEELVNAAQSRLETARRREREARSLEGKSLFAAGQNQPAVEAFHHALDVTPQEEFPEAWATIQNEIGNVQSALALRTKGAEVEKHRTAAKRAYEQALQIRTRDQTPHWWAMVQHNMAVSLLNEGSRESAVDQRKRLMQEAEATLRMVLEVFTRDEFPLDFAMAQNHLGSCLVFQAESSTGPDRHELLARAQESFEAALTVFQPDQSPLMWDVATNNLASALVLGADSPGAENPAERLSEAVRVFQSLLKIHSRETWPQRWARTQNNLSFTWQSQAKLLPNKKIELLDSAEAAARSALEVFDQSSFPRDWALAKSNLAHTLFYLATAQSQSNDATKQRLDEAVRELRQSLQVFTKQDLPFDFARNQNSLAVALMNLALFESGTSRAELLKDAAGACQQSLEVYTLDQMPEQWAKSHNVMASILSRQVEMASANEQIQLARDSVVSMRNVLKVHTATSAPEYHASRIKWIENVEGTIRRLEARLEKRPN